MKPYKGQIAVIITFVIAVIFLFVAVFINISKVSQVKTTTSTVADRAALGLASQIGSISHYYKDKVLKISGSCPATGCQVCGPGWLALALVIIGTVILIPSTLGASLVAGIPTAAIIGSSMLGGINTKFNDMTLHNRLREETLFQALRSMQTDEVELKNVGMSTFHDDSTPQDYVLNAIPGMSGQKTASRFATWYYKKRLPLVSDDNLKTALDTFNSELQRFIVIDKDGWDDKTWKIKKFSYVIKPGDPPANYEITCTNCPPWVQSVADKEIAIIKIDATKTDVWQQVIGGFLQVKLLDLLQRLRSAYPSAFCSLASQCNDPTQTCLCTNYVNNLIGNDLRDFLIKTKDVLEMPVNTKLSNITQWLPLFYDFKLHDDYKGSKDGDLSGDIYLRLTRDYDYIKKSIEELETLNNTATTGIKDVIAAENGHNEYGVGDTRSSCATESCCGHDCWTPCCTPKPCSFAGIYCTAWGGANPPVCVNGDLYGTKPSWCPLGSRSASCACSCNRDPRRSPICDFQGQLSWRSPTAGQWDSTSGSTEVEQAIRILHALNSDIDYIKATIAHLVDAINRGEPWTDSNNNGIPDKGEYTDVNGDGQYTSHQPEESYRNEIVYAWQDKPKPDGTKGFLHLVRVGINDYPKELPKITESAPWLGLEKCHNLNNDSGDFTITTSRYDQDQPTDIGGLKLKRRKNPVEKEFDVPQLYAMMRDIQTTGTLKPDGKYTQADITKLLDNSIMSMSKVHFGPEKNDIYIMETEGDKTNQ